MEERKRRDEEELAGFVNPFSSGVNEVVIQLDDEFFDEPSRHVLNLSSDPEDRVELDRRDIAGAIQQDNGESLESTGIVSDSAVVPVSHPLPQSQPQVSTTPLMKSFGIWRARTPFAAALQNGTLHEKNPVRDYSWAVILGLASLGCMAAGAAHGNVALIGVGLLLATAALYLYYRAEESDPKKSSATSLSIGLGLSQPTLL